MRTDYAENLARLRAYAASNLPWPRDLGLWVQEVVENAVSAAYRQGLRDQLIREAAAKLEGSRKQRARRLAGEADIVRRCWALYCVTIPHGDSLRERMVQAAHMYELPASPRTYMRILRGDTDGVELSPECAGSWAHADAHPSDDSNPRIQRDGS